MHACGGDTVPASKVKWVTASLPSTCQDQERLLKSQSLEGFPRPFYRLSIHRIENGLAGWVGPAEPHAAMANQSLRKDSPGPNDT